MDITKMLNLYHIVGLLILLSFSEGSLVSLELTAGSEGHSIGFAPTLGRSGSLPVEAGSADEFEESPQISVVTDGLTTATGGHEVVFESTITGSPQALANSDEVFAESRGQVRAEALGDAAPRSPRLIEVMPGGPVPGIDAAIALSQAYDTIRVHQGVYTESGIEIRHPLVLEGVGRPVIDGNRGGFILTVRADNVQVRGFEIRNTGVSYVRDFAAILLEDASDFVVEDNVLDDVFFGIYLARTTRGIVRNNRIESYDTREASSGNGIHLWSVVDPVVTGNTVIGMRDGIYLEFAENADIRRNISNKNNRYGLHYMFSNGGRYYENVFRENGAGVAVMYSDRVDMTDNLFEFNWGPSAYGLLLKDIRHSTIERNRFIRNTIAIYAEGVSHTTIKDNEVRRNGWAMNIKSNSMRNTFTGNNFIENSQDVRTDSPRNPNLYEGNYWSHYEGYDLDRDGIGDIPYRPVSLFSIIIERQPEALILMRSMFIRLLDMAERVMPVLTPKALVDEKPLMQPARLEFHHTTVTPIATNQ
jgi:nitrous oxidase accessory protein